MGKFFTIFSLFFLLSTALLAQNGSQNPHGDIKWDCQTCHTTDSWRQMRSPLPFRHEDTGFPLIGEHKFAECAGCHSDLKFAQVGTACADCHSDVHRGQFGIDCQSCHTSDSWQNQQEIFEIHASRGFPLSGVHAIADCQACHVNEQQNEFTMTGVNCYDCHLSDFALSLNPNHAQANFTLDCQSCHVQSSLRWVAPEYKHTERFELRGAHIETDCNSCHTSSYFGTDNQCYSCHADAYNGTTAPAHAAAGFPTDCAFCHGEVQWEGAEFDHLSQSGFALNGAHATADCNSCHANNQFSGLPRDCFGCHQSDFQATDNPDHETGGFPTDCMMCHTEDDWSPALFDHNLTEFPLTGAHMVVICEDCHDNGQFVAIPTECFSCHEGDFNTVEDPNHVANNFNQDCTECHNTDAWSPATFDHNNTQFPLTGAHIPLECLACHDQGYTNTPLECYACHEDDYVSVLDPNHVVNNFNQDCTECHNTSDWEDVLFDHNNTGFPLTGAHVPLNCIECHDQGYTNTPVACYACHHQDDYNSVLDPNHVANNFSQECLDCHNTNKWDEVLFDHNNTQFPLTGAHVPLECLACHAQGYNNTPIACFACHENDFNAVQDPNHVANNFSHECLDCHNTSDWEDVLFDHNNTGFPLTGAHVPLNCIQCHDQGYTNTPTVCFACHEDDFNSVQDPNHVANNFSHECLDCHNTSDWDDVLFDHNNTGFPLTGAHVPLNCIQCHDQGYTNTPTACFACHEDDFNSVQDPNHVANNFSHECLECHNTSDWDDVLFDHNNTGFPLTGAHVPLNCIQCHDQGYTNTPTACFACHEDDFNAVQDPNHVANNFSHECLECHNTSDWEDVLFDHNNTQFPLTGAHVPLNCIQCHEQGYTNTPIECYACHQDDYVAVQDPNHVTNNFNQDCTECHSTTGWTPSTFDHNNTQFPLTGAHVPLNCIECHDQGYVNTPADCFSCHEDDYNSVQDPNHVANNFSHECLECHNTSDWEDVLFDHSNTGFPLTGAHVPLNCLDCHANGYAGTPIECFACHQDDYNGTTNPNHLAAGFPTECETCHGTSNWNNTTWNHDQLYFPIYSGRHQGEWSVCADCHVQPNNFAIFECIFCHEHNQNDMDDEHQGVSGYVYQSAACYSCHPTGNGVPFNPFEKLDRVR